MHIIVNETTHVQLHINSIRVVVTSAAKEPYKHVGKGFKRSRLLQYSLGYKFLKSLCGQVI